MIYSKMQEKTYILLLDRRDNLSPMMVSCMSMMMMRMHR